MLWRKKEWPWPLTNESEAALLSEILTEEGIPHKVVRHGDALWGYATEVGEGFGHLETLPEFNDRVEELFHDFQASESPAPEDVPEEGTR